MKDYLLKISMIFLLISLFTLTFIYYTSTITLNSINNFTQLNSGKKAILIGDVKKISNINNKTFVLFKTDCYVTGIYNSENINLKTNNRALFKTRITTEFNPLIYIEEYKKID